MDKGIFCFFVSGEAKEVFPGTHLWKVPLAGEKNRPSIDISLEPAPEESVIKIGDYFSAVAQFLSKNDFLILRSGLAAVFNTIVQRDQICKIDVFLEKHGAFYHPLKIQVDVKGGGAGSFVLNGAVSKPGLSLIKTEYQLISTLNKTHSKSYLPKVFGIDFIKTDKGKVGFFIGEWFEGYKEFHATQDRGKKQIVVWESDGSCHYLSQTSALPIYRAISKILSYYYDIETFEQVFPWHHAAGDFIVRQEGEQIDVRLITVRGYRPLSRFNDECGDKNVHILPSLMFFFLNLTLRMRLDRLNGTGRSVMLDEKIIPVIVDGFLQALDEKSPDYDFGDLRSIFIGFFQQFNPKQMIEIIENILESCPLDPIEIAIIQENLESHCRVLHLIFKNIKNSVFY
jgi:hypothetical protein